MEGCGKLNYHGGTGEVMNKGVFRLGIIASVLWVIVGGIWTRGIIVDELGRVATNSYSSCLADRSYHDDHIPKETDWTPCHKQFDIDWRRDVTDTGINVGNAIYTFGPLLLAWLSAYILLWLGRWVGAGFKQSA